MDLKKAAAALTSLHPPRPTYSQFDAGWGISGLAQDRDDIPRRWSRNRSAAQTARAATAMGRPLEARLWCLWGGIAFVSTIPRGIAFVSTIPQGMIPIGSELRGISIYGTRYCYRARAVCARSLLFLSPTLSKLVLYPHPAFHLGCQPVSPWTCDMHTNKVLAGPHRVPCLLFNLVAAAFCPCSDHARHRRTKIWLFLRRCKAGL